jgi:hypothetical protein
MPLISRALNQGLAVVDLVITVSGPRAVALQKAKLSTPPPFVTTGILDSGASITCIDPRVRQALGLVPFRVRSILVPSLSTPVRCNYYKIGLMIRHTAGDTLLHSWLSVAETEIAQCGNEILVGCDVLQLCDFRYEGRVGTFSLSF